MRECVNHKSLCDVLSCKNCLNKRHQTKDERYQGSQLCVSRRGEHNLLENHNHLGLN